MPGKNQVYGKDYKTSAIVLSLEEHRAYKVKAATYGITVADVCRVYSCHAPEPHHELECV